jgi:hypothetical protein
MAKCHRRDPAGLEVTHRTDYHAISKNVNKQIDKQLNNDVNAHKVLS